MVTSSAGITIVYAIIEFHRFIPIIHTRRRIEAVIARSFGRHLIVRLYSSLLKIELRRKRLARTIIEIILRRKGHIRVVIFTQIVHSDRLCHRLVLARHVVRHKVNNHFHALLVGAFEQGVEFCHAMVNVYRQVGVNIIIVRNGVRRSCLAFHHSGMLSWDAMPGIICLSGMANYTCIPNMSNAQAVYLLEHSLVNIVHLSTTVFGKRPPLLASLVAVAEKACKDLIDNYLFVHSE